MAYDEAVEAIEPVIKYSLAKYVDKGEDAWTQQPAAEAALGGTAGAGAPPNSAARHAWMHGCIQDRVLPIGRNL